ncbi:MAG: hypothetical protein J6Y15_05645, partial [Bacteroidaceae bacterium]|nr:hypothetical protein [Bacteroidaceae bacterium]
IMMERIALAKLHLFILTHKGIMGFFRISFTLLRPYSMASHYQTPYLRILNSMISIRKQHT